jgi:hypothetical protein
MWVLLVVMLEGNRQILQRGGHVGLGHEGNVIALDRLHELSAMSLLWVLRTGAVNGFKPMHRANSRVLAAM